RDRDHGLQPGYAENQSAESGGRLHALVTQVFGGSLRHRGNGHARPLPESCDLAITQLLELRRGRKSTLFPLSAPKPPENVAVRQMRAADWELRKARSDLPAIRYVSNAQEDPLLVQQIKQQPFHKHDRRCEQKRLVRS